MIARLHAWDLSPEEAALVQTELRTRLILTWDKRPVTTIAGVGLWLECPTIGVTKSRLYGQPTEVGPGRGDLADLLDKQGNIIGTGWRPRERTDPLYFSPGHLIDVETATGFVQACLTSYRLPEPTRWAHKVAGGDKLPVEGSDQPRLF